jgi:hypothetical protein
MLSHKDQRLTQTTCPVLNLFITIPTTQSKAAAIRCPSIAVLKLYPLYPEKDRKKLSARSLGQVTIEPRNNTIFSIVIIQYLLCMHYLTPEPAWQEIGASNYNIQKKNPHAPGPTCIAGLLRAFRESMCRPYNIPEQYIFLRQWNHHADLHR